VNRLGHLPTSDHNAFNATPLAVVNVSRECTARYGYSPASRVFDAAGAGACIITDRCEGVDRFLRPGREVLIAADGDEVAEHVRMLDTERAAEIGRAARRRVLANHTFAQRAAEFEAQLYACSVALEVT
jgi:spore maturation protein CgeB